MENDVRFNLVDALKKREDRYIYYVTGLNVASLGFTINKTFELTPDRTHDVFLALAILGWVISTITAFRWIIIQLRIMEINLEMSDLYRLLDEGQNRKLRDEKSIQGEFNQKREQLTNDAKRCSKSIKAMLLFFICGMLFFITWRIMDMYLS